VSEGEIIRDLITATRPGPTPDKMDRRPEGERHLPQAPAPKSGMARITEVIGGGTYKVTECSSSDGSGTPMVAPAGFVDRKAFAIDGTTAWEVDDDVFYRQVPDGSGKYVTVIERRVGPVTLDTTVGFCGLLNIRVDKMGNIVAAQVSTGGSPASKWVDAQGRDI